MLTKQAFFPRQWKVFKKLVLDDDPTGVQTVHDVSVYTDWEEESIRKGFEEKESMFFILTNSPQLFCGKTKGTPGYCRTCCKGGRGTGTGFHDHFPWRFHFKRSLSVGNTVCVKAWLTGIQPDQRKRQQTMELLQGAQLLTVRSSARLFQKVAATQWTISIM